MKAKVSKRLALAITSLLLVSGCLSGIVPGGSGGGVGPEEHGGITFQTDYDGAMSQAAQEGKPLLVYFWAPWCVWCDRYHENVFPQDGVKEQADRYVKVAVNVDENQDLVDQYGVRGPPVLVMLDPESGRVIQRMDGYPNPDAVDDPATFLANMLKTTHEVYSTQ